jgi:hypothetical protein
MKWIFVLFFLVILLFIGGIVALIVWVIRKSTKPKSNEFVVNEKQEMLKRVEEMKPELSPWSNYSYQDITSAMMFKYKMGMSNTLKGKIYAPDQKPIVAFDRVERGLAANGYMFAATSEFNVYFDIKVNEFKIKFNDVWLGHISKTGKIRDTTGKEIGSAQHPIKASFNIAMFKYRSGDNKFPLHMNGRLLASIWVAPNYSEGAPSSISLIFNENNWGQPILQLHDQPTKEEEKWLTSLAILETAFHGHWLI